MCKTGLQSSLILQSFVSEEKTEEASFGVGLSMK